MTSPIVLARLRSVPTRVATGLLTFGGLVGVPTALVAVGVVFFAVDLVPLGMACVLLACASFVGATVMAFYFIFSAQARLRRAEAAVYAGDFETATQGAHTVLKTVFRSDYQMSALFTLALVAERVGAFAEAGALFTRALGMVPAMAAAVPGRRARALFSAHAALSLAAAGDLARASAMLAHCHAQLGATGTGALDALLDDSYMGAIGINSMMVELENRRDARPLAVLAGLLIAFKSGHIHEVGRLVAQERPAIDHGLGAHERALAVRIQDEALRLASGAAPHRSPSPLARLDGSGASTWAHLVLPVSQ